MAKYECQYMGCNYSTDSPQGFAGHMNGHKTKKLKEAKAETKQLTMAITPQEWVKWNHQLLVQIADLERIVSDYTKVLHTANDKIQQQKQEIIQLYNDREKLEEALKKQQLAIIENGQAQAYQEYAKAH
jgi:hypothetical protein